MMVIFYDYIHNFIEVFMNDFYAFGPSFDVCLANLHTLKRCEKVNRVLSWEKSHFMVQKGIVLGYKVSKKKLRLIKSRLI